MIVPDWFYSAVLDDALILTIDRAYFNLTGGLDRWLYRLVRKHGGRQKTVGGSTSVTCTRNRAVCRRSSASPSSCATLSAASHCPATPCSPRSKPAAGCCSLSSLSRPVENLWIVSCYREPGLSCHQEPEARAIGNPNTSYPSVTKAKIAPLT